MSLFPAYGEKEGEAGSDTNGTQWLQNNSFPLQPEQVENVKAAEPESVEEPMEISSGSDSDEDGKDVIIVTTDAETDEQGKKKSKKRRKHKKKSKRKDEQEVVVIADAQHATEEPGFQVKEEEFYEDKKAALSYKRVNTLGFPARPKYTLDFRVTLGQSYKPKRWKFRRYFEEKYAITEEAKAESLTETEYLNEQGILNRKLLESPSDLTVWLDYVKLQDRNPYKWPRLFLAEKKMDLIQKALRYHPSNDILYRAYFEAITDTFPAFEVAKFLDKMLSKDPYSYVLWTAQIITTQGSMARCVVPEVLRIYEKCMQKMHHAQKKNKLDQNSDWVMLKLFNNCALFLRQAGLFEQFFALIKLALELNVSAELFGDFAPKAEEQNTLIEYEELVLQSGLPMNEIWLRIEKLRQAFNFLPMPENSKCSDPQRIVFNEDVCHYIYPLKEKENAFFLMLLIIRLLKIPFIQSDVLTGKFIARVEHIGDSDAIEDMLSMCLRRTFALPVRDQNNFLTCLLEIAKDMATAPSFLSNMIGNEIYIRTLNHMLISCAEAFNGINERKRIVFLSLWCKFERVLLILNKLQDKLTPDYVKEMRNRFKNLLKQKVNRNVLNIFTEFAICEYEALDNNGSLETVTKIFDSILEVHYGNEAMASDLSHIYLVYIEILIGCNQFESALQILTCYAANINIKNKENFSSSKKLAALKKLKEKVETIMDIEKKVKIMVLEQYLLPDHSLSLLRMYCFMACLMDQKFDALEYLGQLTQIFLPDENDRHNFLRENILELEIIILQLPIQSTVTVHLMLSKKITSALASYPRNLFFLQTCGIQPSIAAYQLKGAMLNSPDPTVQAITFFIASHKFRFVLNRSESILSIGILNQLDLLHNEKIVRCRVLNVFREFSTKINNASKSSSTNKNIYNALRRNALFWRFYLRSLSSKQISFEMSKNCLLMALDECPWNKALYLDGATFVPQELPHLQDLMIEKQLRVYALPEELEILRE